MAETHNELPSEFPRLLPNEFPRLFPSELPSEFPSCEEVLEVPVELRLLRSMVGVA